jgi:sec-independent protein translocase protein TatA
MGLGKIEIIFIIILVIVLLFAGGKKLPELARGLGQSAKELRKGFKDDKDEDSENKSSEK